MNVEQERALKQYVEEAFQPLAHIINSMGRDLRQMTQTMLQPLLNTTIVPFSHHITQLDLTLKLHVDIKVYQEESLF